MELDPIRLTENEFATLESYSFEENVSGIIRSAILMRAVSKL